MLILRSPAEMHEWSRGEIRNGKSIGFVPTMGALHKGHATLMENAADNNDVSVLSIFVNPTQFNVSEDFEKYPRTFDADVEVAKKHNVNVVYAPSVDSMYPDGASVLVQPGSAAERMEGAMRPGHFTGVTTVVAKLLNSVLPDRAYFGKKDYQQLAVIRQMVKDLDFPVEIVGIDTVREPDGLALSSRNVRLTSEHRSNAVSISQGLFAAREMHHQGQRHADDLRKIVLSSIGDGVDIRTEYVDVCHPVSLQPITDTTEGAVICVAAWFGDVRLIDNIELSPH